MQWVSLLMVSVHQSGCGELGVRTLAWVQLSYYAGLSPELCTFPGLQTCGRHQFTGPVVRECLSTSLAAPYIVLNPRLTVPDFLGRLHV